MSLICFKSSFPVRYRLVMQVLLAVWEETRRSFDIHLTTSFPPTILVILIFPTIPAVWQISFIYLLYPEMLILGILPPYFIRILSTSSVRRGIATSFFVFFCLLIRAEWLLPFTSKWTISLKVMDVQSENLSPVKHPTRK